MAKVDENGRPLPNGATYNGVLKDITTNVEQPQAPSPVLSGAASSLVVPTPIFQGDGISFESPASTPALSPPALFVAQPPAPNTNPGLIVNPNSFSGPPPVSPSGTVSGTTQLRSTIPVPRRKKSRAKAGNGITGPTAGPLGPSGNWSLIWHDEFLGTSLDTTRWWPASGIEIATTDMFTSNVSVSGGFLNLTFAGTNNGGAVISAAQTVQGWFQSCTNPGGLAVGNCVEAKISFPGNTGTGAIYNWPAFWFLCEDNNAGEIDLAEGLGGSLTVNYHDNANNFSGPAPSGNFASTFHTYTVVRNNSSFDAYYDGTHVWNETTGDDGYVMCIILDNAYGTFGGTEVTGQVMQVEYVRVFTPVVVN